MSISLDFESLSLDVKKDIAKDLFIKPKETFTMGSMSMQSSSTPFPFFQIFKETGEIRLPFFYGIEKFCNNYFDDSSLPYKRCFGYESLVHPLPHQLSIIEETMNNLKEHGCTTIQAQPGCGKTFMAMYIANILGLRTAAISPRSTLNTQWCTTYRKMFGDKYIYEPEQPSSKKKKVVLKEHDLIVCLGERVVGIENIESVGLLIIDEAHLFCTPSRVEQILRFSPRYVIALTATLPRVDETHVMMHRLVGFTGYTQTPDRYYELYKVRVPIKVPEHSNKFTGKLDYVKLCGDISLNEEYNKAILKVVKKHKDRKFIILTKLVSHAKLLKEMMNEDEELKEVSVELLFGNKKKYVNCKVLIGTYNKISTGFDAATFADDFDGVSPDSIVLCQSIKEWQSYVQSVGRIMRCSKEVTPYVFWMVPENKIFEKHLKGLEKFIKSTKGVIMQTS